METRWLYTTSENFPTLVKESKEVCLLPMGCVEKHGLHLPLGTDVFEAAEISHKASQIEAACVFPEFAFGDVPGGPAMPAGSISMPVTLEMELLELLCDQIGRNGFKKILICNGHGGNTPWLSTFLRDLMNRKKDYVCAVYEMNSSRSPYFIAEILKEKGRGSVPYLTTEDEDYILCFCAQKKEVGHACLGETACVMGLHPETVHLDRLGIESGLSTHEADYLKEAGVQMVNGGWDVNYCNAYHGHDPIGCNERIGKASVHVQANRLARAIKVLKEDRNLLRWHAAFQKGM